MTARFHINSIDKESLKRAGWTFCTVQNGEVVTIRNIRGEYLDRGDAEFERILLACMNKPRLANIGGDDNSDMSEG